MSVLGDHVVDDPCPKFSGFLLRRTGEEGEAVARWSELTFATWAEANRLCDGGFGSETLARSMYERAKLFFAAGPFPAIPWYYTVAFCPALLLTARHAKQTIRVLDFGGQAGNLYYLASELLPDAHLIWAVVETEQLVRVAERDQSPAGLRFFRDIKAAAEWLGHADVVHSSGAIQYTPDPSATLATLLAVRPSTLVLQRCAMALDDQFITI